MLEPGRRSKNIQIPLSHIELYGWFTPDPAEQFHNPYLAMANNPVRYTDPTGMTVPLYDEEAAGGGNNTSSNFDFPWDINYDIHGMHGGGSSYSNWGAGHGSYLLSNYSWLNAYGAHNGSFAPIYQNGHIVYFNSDRGEYGYEIEYNEISGSYFELYNGDLYKYENVSSAVVEWVSLDQGGGSGVDPLTLKKPTDPPTKRRFGTPYVEKEKPFIYIPGPYDGPGSNWANVGAFMGDLEHFCYGQAGFERLQYLVTKTGTVLLSRSLSKMMFPGTNLFPLNTPGLELILDGSSIGPYKDRYQYPRN